MIRGLYSSSSSLLALLRQQEVLSHNLANIATPGFKQEIVLSQEGLRTSLVRDEGPTSEPVGSLGLGVDEMTRFDFSQGPLEHTQRPLDLAILGQGFFRVQTPDGIRLTRDGSFHRDAAGQLVTAAGYPVLGENGPIRIDGEDLFIDSDGRIYVRGSNGPVARITLVTVDLASLKPQAGNLWDPGDSPLTVMPAQETHMKQGFLEQANVDISRTVVGMMLALRSYEATQRSLHLQDEALRQLMDVARVA
jgi:flagellar basal-body rod protein FlgG